MCGLLKNEPDNLYPKLRKPTGQAWGVRLAEQAVELDLHTAEKRIGLIACSGLDQAEKKQLN
jgi:hypothetical protein